MVPLCGETENDTFAGFSSAALSSATFPESNLTQGLAPESSGLMEPARRMGSLTQKKLQTTARKGGKQGSGNRTAETYPLHWGKTVTIVLLRPTMTQGSSLQNVILLPPASEAPREPVQGADLGGLPQTC